MKYHNQLLTLHGPSGSSPGKWTLSRIGTPEERMSLNREIRVLEEKLKEVEGWEARVQELEALLGVQEEINGHEEDRNEEEEKAIQAQEILDGQPSERETISDVESETSREDDVLSSEVAWENLQS